jgi:hypothetical protein
MKKLLVILIASIAVACGGGKKTTSTPTNTSGAQTAPDPKMQGSGDQKKTDKPEAGNTEEDPCAAPH